MDQDSGSNQNLANNLCRSGCGFWGSPKNDGMCSKCYKDSVQRRNQNPSPIQVQGRSTPTVSSALSSSLSNLPESVKSSVAAAASKKRAEIASSTVPSTSQEKEKSSSDKETVSEGATAAPASPSSSEANSIVAEESKEGDEKEKKVPKKNRCLTCKKKVGLTGFECRCGGLFCGLHRYSDKHNCTFDYKELAKQQIQKANPVICGEKINKI